MTFTEFKFYLKRTRTEIGPLTFYTVPNNRRTAGSAKLPAECIVNVSTNKHGKRILDFVTEKKMYGDADELDFVLDPEIAAAHATKLQMIRRNNILNELKTFERETNVIENIKMYSELYPEIFV